MKGDAVVFVVLLALIGAAFATMKFLDGRGALPRQYSENQLRQMIRDEVRAALDGGIR